MNSIDKQLLRRRCRDIRQSLSLPAQLQAQAALVAHIQSLTVYRQARHIALYHALPGELDLSPLLHTALKNHIACYLPHINPDKTLSFLPITTSTRMRTNGYHIPEPDVPLTAAIPLQAIDLMCTPLLAYDLQGHRLGQGGGYYDRTLALMRPGCVLGIAYSVQCQPCIPHDAWDAPLDAVATECGVHWFHA
jgi:5-formyltetrahydrofolate cyclo-ligase